MRDFFFRYSPNSQNLSLDYPLSYFNDLFPDADNRYLKSERFILVYSEDNNNQSADIIWNKGGKICLFCSGQYYIPDKLKAIYGTSLSDNSLILKLLELHGVNVFQEFSGNFNFLIHDTEKQEVTIINSKLGLYPLYYYYINDELIISTRLGIFKPFLSENSINYAVVLQHCLYNYPLSSKTFLKNVNLLPSASKLVVSNKKLRLFKYWEVSNAINNTQRLKGFHQSIDILDSVLDLLIRRQCSENEKLGISLTGGWDGRLILSYALKYLPAEQITLYSHGVSESPDVKLPMQTSKKLKFNYVPVLLDDLVYLKQQTKLAYETVKYSDGIRQINRVHYLYNMSVLRNEYKINAILSGNGGSNLLKSTNFKPCDVSNKYVLELIESHDLECTIKKHFEYCMLKYRFLFKDLSLQDFVNSFDFEYISAIISIKNKYRRFLQFLISDVEKKYFGYELQSYKHLIKNYSPFFDDDFIHALLQTTFIEFEGNKGLIRSHNISRLYAILTRRNNLLLSKEPTDRGFSLYEVANPLLFPIMIYKYFQKKLNKSKYLDYFGLNNLIEQYTADYLPDIMINKSLLKSDDYFIINFLSFLSFERM